MATALIPRLLLTGIACCHAGAAMAGTWQGDQRAGNLKFTATQAGATFTGAFQRFKVRFEFDAKDPSRGKLDVTVPIASVNTQDADRDEILRGRDFFWIETFPEAVFHADRFEPNGKGWRASGQLTMRGVTQPATLRFELKPAAKRLTMKGTADLRRLEFGIGQGEWSATEWIGDEVGVRFDLKLVPADAAANP